MNENKPLVVVLSRNYSTGLSVIRSLGEAGYTVDLVASSYKPGASRIAACSRFVRRQVEVITKNIKEGDMEVELPLLNAIIKFADQTNGKPVLFPTDDYTTSVMDRNRSILEDHYIMPTIVGGGDGCMTERMSKVFQAELAREAGLRVPMEWVIDLSGDPEIPEDMVYPCFVKPLESVTGYKKEMARCDTPQKLEKHLKKLKDRFPDRGVLVQEFLQIDNEIDFSGVCLDQKIVLPAIIRKWNVAKHETGVTLAGRVVPAQELGELYDKVIAMLKKLRYVGMFDMELNVVGDRIYFNEVNLRSGGPNFSYFRSGVNLPDLFVKGALGLSHEPEEEQVDTFGKSFLYEKVAWEDHIHGFMTRQQLEDRIAAADITLLHYDNDPAPGKYFDQQMRRAKFAYKLKKIKRKWVKRLKEFKKNLYSDLLPLVNFLRKCKHSILGYPQVRKENRRNPFAPLPRVLVAGRNYCSNLTMARALGQAGYEVEVLRIFQVKPQFGSLARFLYPDAYSKYIKAFHVLVSRRKPKRIVKKLISIADPYRKMLLIPCDDLLANIADEYMTKLGRYYIMPNVQNLPGQISRMMSKSVQKELATAAGLPMVNSCVIQAYKGRFEIPESVTYPCFMKPNVSKNSSKSRMRKCENREQLEQALTEFSKRKHIEMLVEDFLDIHREYSILGVSTKDGVAAPGFFVQERGGHDGHIGVAMTGKTLHCGVQQKLIDDCTAFVAGLGFDGLFDIDLIQTADGTIYFVELNMRFGASGYAFCKAGVNMAGMFADYMLKGKPIDTDCKTERDGLEFLSEKIMIDEYVSGYINRQDIIRLMKETQVQFVYDKDDPQAYNHFKKVYPYAALLRAVKTIKNKLS